MLMAPKSVVEGKSNMTDEMKAEMVRVKDMLFDGVNYTDEEANAAISAFNQKAKEYGVQSMSIATREMVPSWQIKR